MVVNEATRSTDEMALTVLASLHIIPYLRWEREGDATFELKRARLLDTLTLLANMISIKNGDALRHLLLSGQTVILEDIASLHPDLLTFLIVSNASRRVEVGPWYIGVDDTLVSGESLIRNLFAARMDADKHGVALSTVAYTPDPAGHTAQLPQILRGFGIDAAFLHHGAPVVHLPFRWESPDGSSILVISHDNRQNAALSVHDQRSVKPDGPFLWMSAADQPHKLRPAGVTMPILQTSLMTYVAALRKGMDDGLRPVLRGEMRFQGKREGGYLLSGTTSARIHLKQRNSALQNLLTYNVEPLIALALTHGKLDFAENVRLMLSQSWRLLMKNQSRPILGGYAIDPVVDEAEVRSRQVEDSARYVLDRALNALPGKLHAPQRPPTETTCVVVWNVRNWAVRQVVEIRLDIAPHQHPVQLLSPAGEELLFSWSPQTRMLSFLAEAPSVGYASYTVSLGDAPLLESLIRTSTATTIADSSGTTFSVDTGELVWRFGQDEIVNVLRFIDSGDAGDVFNYSPPLEDVIEQAMLVSGMQTEASALYERLIFRHRVRIAPQLRQDRNRDRGVRLLEFTTSATFYDGMPGLYFHTDFTNTAEDHRLSVHLKTGIQSDTVLADSAFGVVERPVQSQGSPYAHGAKTEGVSSTYPMLNGCAVEDQHRAMGLMVRGLPEFEALHEDNQTTLALTLLRAVGWISRDDLRTRSASIGRVRSAPGAQCLRPMSADYALMPLPARNHAAFLRANSSYNAPLQAYQYDQRPEKPVQSYLSIQSSLGTGGESDGNGALLTALKPPQTGKGWIVRLFNPTAETVEVNITPNRKPKYARLTTLAEEPISIVEQDANGTMQLVIPSQKLVTLRLGFS